MAARLQASKGGKPDKLIRNALMVALKRDHMGDDGKKVSKLTAIAAKLVEKAIDGDTSAIKEIADRVDGKSVQPVDPGPEFSKILREVTVNFVDVGIRGR